uniref:Histone deacetylase n=1 Tax=Strigamia maritima TaxID=126957 RepID=T1JB29_STRMM
MIDRMIGENMRHNTRVQYHELFKLHDSYTADINNASPVTSPVLSRRDVSNNMTNNSVADSLLREQEFQQTILRLKEEQQLQQEYLVRQFQRQQQQLAEQHEKQLQQHIKEYLEQQKKLDEEERQDRERREKQKLEALMKKEKHEESAVASSEVKLRLQHFIVQKKQREAAANNREVNQLRKTASEPNLKVRSGFKQKVIENRSSPLPRRKDKGCFPPKRKLPITNTGSSTPDSGPNSPPSSSIIPTSRSSSGSTSIQEDPNGSPYSSVGQGSFGDLTLYSSPSMPNISVGRPTVLSSNVSEGSKVSPATEDQLRALVASRLGMPLTCNMLHSSTLSFYPVLPGAFEIVASMCVLQVATNSSSIDLSAIESEFTPPTSPAYIQQQMKALEQARTSGPSSVAAGMYHQGGGAITDAQVAQARLHRAGHRPLGRTQSAPLPLDHPMLQPQNMILNPHQQEQFLREKQMYELQQQHNLLKQHIRQTVLTRASSKNQVENVEEETEAAVAQEMKDLDKQPEVIDLTERKAGDSELAKHHQRERDAILQQQQRDLMMRHTLQISEGSAFTPRHHTARPLSRALSSPLVTLSLTGSSQESPSTTKHVFTTGLIFDSYMLKHQCVCSNNSNHPEHGGRLQSIWARLGETGLVARCERVRSRKATLEEIQSCHNEAYTLLFGTNPLNRQKLDLNDLPIKSFVMLSCGGIGVDSDTTWNELHTAGAARMAVGCVIELALKTASGEIKNGFAVVRPPGHHAESQQAMGFCFFNSVAIAAKQLRQRLKLEKILIVDWDVHHGNGTQQMFYNDRHVLYLSLHRHDDGNFFPGTGGPEEVGEGEGVGFTVNITWSGALNPPMGDAEYLTAFRTIIMPIAREFNPDIILVSSGFDAATGHPAPLGGYKVSPACFGHMTRQLMQLANGKVVLALEGGYDLPAICDASQECVRVLLGDEPTALKEEELVRKPCKPAIETLQKVLSVQAIHWPCVKRWAHTYGYSLVEAQQKEKEEVETVTALASLSMAHPAQPHLQRRHESSEHEEPMDEDQEQPK